MNHQILKSHEIPFSAHRDLNTLQWWRRVALSFSLFLKQMRWVTEIWKLVLGITDVIRVRYPILKLCIKTMLRQRGTAQEKWGDVLNYPLLTDIISPSIRSQCDVHFHLFPISLSWTDGLISTCKMLSFFFIYSFLHFCFSVLFTSFARAALCLHCWVTMRSRKLRICFHEIWN